MSWQQTIIVGNVGNDVEVAITQGGTKYAKISIATNEVWKDKEGNKQERVTWWRVTVWGDVAENCGKYVTKGQQLTVVGRAAASAWLPKDSDEPKASLELSATNVIFGPRPGGKQREPEPWEGQTRSDADGEPEESY